jgi:hypothetical protein
MATVSFTKNFVIAKKETMDRLEKAIENIEPLNIEPKDVIVNLKRSEKRLLNIFRSKA